MKKKKPNRSTKKLPIKIKRLKEALIDTKKNKLKEFIIETNGYFEEDVNVKKRIANALEIIAQKFS